MLAYCVLVWWYTYIWFWWKMKTYLFHVCSVKASITLTAQLFVRPISVAHVALFRHRLASHGFIWSRSNEYLLISQFALLKPVSHWQLYVRSVSAAHVAPFRHELASHGFIWSRSNEYLIISQFAPLNPVSHWQLYVIPVSGAHVAPLRHGLASHGFMLSK